MKRWTLRTTLLMVALGCLGVGGRSAQGEERAREFLDGLREQGYFDVALDYLEQLRASPLCPADLKESIDYEAAITLMSGSLVIQDPKLRIQALDDARDKFDAFIKANPSHPLVAGARMQLANVLVERGRFKMEQSGKTTTKAEEKKQLMADARTLFQDAQKVFTDADAYFTQQHATFNKTIDPKKTKEIEARDQVRKDMLTARLYLCQVAYEIAKTYPEGSKEFKEEMGLAAKKFNDMYNKYKKFTAGLYARMWEGRCYKEIGDAASLKTALAIFEEMMVQPDEPKAFRDMKNKSLVLMMEAMRLPAINKPADALAKAKEWEESARPTDENSPDGLAIHFLGGQCALTLLKAMKNTDKGYNDMRKEARRHFDFVSRFAGQHQADARAQLRDPLLGGAAEIQEPRTFAEARDLGKTALDEMQAAQVELEIKRGQGPVDEKTRAEFKVRMDTGRDQAKAYFHKALELAASETATEEVVNDLNGIRYYMAYLYWASEDYFDAAVMGDFLARRYPNSAGARNGAKIAMAAFVKMYSDIPKDGDRSFEGRQLADIAQYITRRWPGGPEAQDAWIMLIRTAIADQDANKAREYLEKLSPESAKRAEAEMLVGQALWSGYLRGGALPEDNRPAQAELEKMVKDAKEYLEKGVARMQKDAEASGQVTFTLISSVLSLAQIYVESGEPKKALEKLEDPKTGPLALVIAGNAITDRATFPVEAYKAALRAYVADQQLDKAEKTMDALEKLMSASGEEAGKKLTQIYISLGLELQKQVKRLRDEKKEAELKVVSNGFELFLTRIADRPGNSFNSLHWVAETFYSLGSGLDTGGRTPPENAKKYYEKARSTYQKILAQMEEGKLTAPKGADTTVRIRLARCLRRLGMCKEALNLLVEVIVEHPMMVDVQTEAAYTYQAWGAEPGMEKYYANAIKGGKKAKRKEDNQEVYLVWGWGKIARLVVRSPQHRDIFHEARYNLALARSEYANALKSASDRKAALEQAEQDVLIIQKLFPNVGGPEWFEKYNDLLKKIQKALGKSAAGMEKPVKVWQKEAEEKAAAEKAAKAAAEKAAEKAAEQPAETSEEKPAEKPDEKAAAEAAATK
jgi:hypothetical protein